MPIGNRVHHAEKVYTSCLKNTKCRIHSITKLLHFLTNMEAVLVRLNDSLRDACRALEETYSHDRLGLLQSGDTLPDRELLRLATEAVDLSDRIQRMLQPPSLILAESFLGKRAFIKQGAMP
jgi:hypothetical protein